MRITETVRLCGVCRVRVFRRGALIDEWEDRNLVVNGGRALVTRLATGSGGGVYINRVAVGTSGNIPVPDDAEITEPFIKAIDRVSYPAANQALLDWSLAVTEANGTAIRELGLVCTDGTLFARRILNKVVYKESDIAIEGQWLITY